MALDPGFKQSLIDWANQYKKQKEAVFAQRGAVSGLGPEISGWDSRLRDVLALADQASLGPEHADLIKGAINFGSHQMLGLSELAQQGAARQKQQQQLTDFRTKAETQMFGAPGLDLSTALTSTGGELGQLSNVLRQQQSDVFNQELRPLIDQKLASQGLFDSGARVEQQAKALGGLERARQQTLLQAALSGKEGIRGLERSDILGDIGSQQQSLSNLMDLQRSALSFQWQQSLSRERDALARELSSYGGGGDIGSFLTGVAGAGIGATYGGPTGAALGWQIGSQSGRFFR